MEPKDMRLEDVVVELQALDARLDPEPRRRGRLIADLIAFLAVTVLTLAYDLSLTYPLVLVLLLLAARGTTWVIDACRELEDQRRRDRLLKSLGDRRVE